MRRSIRSKITLCLVAIITFMILLSGILAVCFIKKYYYYELRKDLINTYEECNTYIYDGVFDEESFMDKFFMDNDAMLFILDDTNYQIYTNVNKETTVYNGLRNMVQSLYFSDTFANRSSIFMAEIVEETDDYVIQITNDVDTSQNYFDLCGYLDNGFVIDIRMSVARVDATIKTVPKFYIAILVITAIISCILMYFFSDIFAKPIKRLARVAKRMANLEFDAYIEHISNDEIGELSGYMNDMTYKLNYTLTELKDTNEKLQVELAKKDQLEEMRKEFLSHVSHELKTPIALVQGYAEGLKDNVNDDEESKDFYCDVIMDEANKMNDLVKQLLDLNEIEFGENRVSKEVFDIADLMKNSIASSQILIEQNEVKLCYDESDAIMVYADEFMMEGVFRNYLTNAIHYCNPGGLVRIWCEKLMYEQPVAMDNQSIIGNLRVYVYDQGPTIPESEMEKLFIKFYKMDKARTREYGGSGIGLSIVAATMMAHQKNYGVYNTEDGVVFYFDVDVVG